MTRGHGPDAPAARRARAAGAGRAAALAAAVLLAACGRAGDASADGTDARGASPRSAPTVLTLEELAARLAPASLERPLLVNLWATWCAPCLAEMPALHAVAAAHAGELDVVTVSLDIAMPFSPGVEGPDDVAAFAAKRGIELPILLYDGTPEELSARLELPGPIPFSFVLDAAGRRVGAHEGQLDRAGFDALIAPALR